MMKDKPVSTREKKLQTLRKILYMSFAAVAVPIVLFTIISTIAYFNYSSSISIIEGLIILGILLIFTGIAALILYAIYYFYKMRIEKDNDLFL